MLLWQNRLTDVATEKCKPADKPALVCILFQKDHVGGPHIITARTRGGGSGWQQRRGGSVAVGVGLVGPVDLDANVGGLLVCQCRQLGAELAKVQPRHLLVQNLRRSSTV